MLQSSKRLVITMWQVFGAVIPARALRSDRRASVGVVFALSLVALVPAIGIAVDYARIVQFKSALQNAADSAALAGASAFTDAAHQSTATALADNYLGKAIAALPTNNGVTHTYPVGAVLTSGGTNTGYTVKVSASGSIKTMFMSAVMGAMNVSVTATAENPVLTISISASNVSSNASDRNIVYAYPIPLDKSLPKAADLVQIADNNKTSNPTVTFKMVASQNLGFALKNVTGGRQYYAKNAYGAPGNSTNTFYSQSKQVSQNTTQTDPTAQSNYAKNTDNCSLISVDVTSNPTTKALAPISGSCQSTTPGQYTQNFLLDCTKNANRNIRYYWNDMGGYPTDDKDYDDMAYTVNCPKASPTLKGVALIQ